MNDEKSQIKFIGIAIALYFILCLNTKCMSPLRPRVDYTDSIEYKKHYFLDNSLFMDVPANWVVFPQVIENMCFFPFHQSEIVSKPNAVGAIMVAKYEYNEEEEKPAFMFIENNNFFLLKKHFSDSGKTISKCINCTPYFPHYAEAITKEKEYINVFYRFSEAKDEVFEIRMQINAENKVLNKIIDIAGKMKKSVKLIENANE